MDKKIVIGTGLGSFYGNYVQEVISRQGIYEKTIRCEDCSQFGEDVATLGNLIVTSGMQDSLNKVFMYITEKELLRSLEQEHKIFDVAISEQFIVSTSEFGKTIIYSNSSPEFSKIAEINKKGRVAVSNDRLVIGDFSVNDNDGAAYLYRTDGKLVTTLNRQDASSESRFGWSVDITNDKVLIGADTDDDQGSLSGSVFIYSAVTGEFMEKAVAPDAEAHDRFGFSVCASDSYYIVGASGDNDNGENSGAAYLFEFSED